MPQTCGRGLSVLGGGKEGADGCEADSSLTVSEEALLLLAPLDSLPELLAAAIVLCSISADMIYREAARDRRFVELGLQLLLTRVGGGSRLGMFGAAGQGYNNMQVWPNG